MQEFHKAYRTSQALGAIAHTLADILKEQCGIWELNKQQENLLQVLVNQTKVMQDMVELFV